MVVVVGIVVVVATVVVLLVVVVVGIVVVVVSGVRPIGIAVHAASATTPRAERRRFTMLRTDRILVLCSDR